MSCIWSRSTCAIPVFSWQGTSSPVYVRNMELREKYGMWLSECKVSLYKQTLHISTQNFRITEWLYLTAYIFRRKQYLIYDIGFFYSYRWNESEKYIVFIQYFYLVYDENMKKSGLSCRQSWRIEKLSFAFIKLEKMSIDRSLLFETFYEVQSIKRDRLYTVVYTRYCDTSTCSIRILLARSNNGHVA